MSILYKTDPILYKTKNEALYKTLSAALPARRCTFQLLENSFRNCESTFRRKKKEKSEKLKFLRKSERNE